jgi:hypothetical protein
VVILSHLTLLTGDKDMANSLDAAVAAGVITEEAAFCGLLPADVAKLAEAGFASEFVLVRFRNAQRDGRAVLSISTLAYANTLGRFPQYAETAVDGFDYSDVRDVLGVAK